MTAHDKRDIKTLLLHASKRFWQSVWFFPVILLIPLAVLTVFQISGSSMGVYHSVLQGPGKDPDLLFGRPREIRSDEWVVNTQMTIAQKNDGFARINPNIGKGEDVSLLIDVPYKEWSVIFKPHNLAFFVLPFDNAFAFRWWLMAYLLIASCYFFIVTLLPSKRVIAALLSIAFYFSPFIQWWYLYGTLGTLYYSLFGATVFMMLIRQKGFVKSALWGLLLAYIAVCFALILYPPFQIPCALVMLVFAVGYMLERRITMPRKIILQKASILVGSLILAGGLTLLFVMTRSGVIHAVQNTAYPGKRLVQSGGYDAAHLLSGNLDYQLQFTRRAAHYVIPGIAGNQSEAASFLFLWPFLLIPCFLILLNDYRRREFKDWPLLFVNVSFLVLLAWMFVPHLNFIGKLTFLDVVPHNRLVMGLGLLGFIQLVLLIRRLSDVDRLFSAHKLIILVYSALILLLEIFLDLHAKARLPGFIGSYKALIFAVPVPLIIFAVLKNRLRLAMAVLLVFSLSMTILINPFYKGTSILTSGKLTSAIKAAASQDPTGRWAIEDGNLENFASMNGAPSLSGLYTYPQLNLWRPIDPQLKETSIYNRYAHVSVNFDRSGSDQMASSLFLLSADHFGVRTEPCSSFLKAEGVKFALVEVPFANSDLRCSHLISKINTPNLNFYIYRLD